MRLSSARILHLITRLDNGGSAENTLLTAIGQVQKGHRVTVMYGNGPAPASTEISAREAGVVFTCCKHLCRSIAPIKDICSLFSITLHLWRNKYDIVHTHTSKAGIIGRLAAKFAKIPCIVHTPHGHVFYGYFGRMVTGFFVCLEWVSQFWTDAHIALTEKEKMEYLERKIGVASRFFVVPSGIALERFSPGKVDRESIRKRWNITEEEFVCMTVARLAPVKNHRLIIKAAKRLEAYRKELRFFFVGDGELEFSLQNHAKESNVEEMFRWLGWKTEIPELLWAADCFVLCSLNEGMGRVFVEAQAAGLPVIGSRVCGIPEIVQEGVTGFLLSPDDAEGLANAIERLYVDLPLRKQIAKAATQTVLRKYSVESMIDGIESVYQQVCNRKER